MHKEQTQTRVIILGAGRPYRGNNPSALVQTTGNRRTLDWTLDAFDRVMEMEVYFVGGYRLDEIVQAYPNIIFSVNPNWESQGTLGSLLAAPLASDLTTYICYSDIVITADIVKLLQDAAGDVVLVADRDWRHRYEARSTEDMASAEKLKIVDGRVTEIDLDIPVEQTDAEFVGIMKLSPRAVSQLITFRERQQELAANGMPRLIQEFLAAGLDVTPAEIEGGWAELNAPQDLARFVLGTKADTLERLRSVVRQSVIGEQVKFTLSEWKDDQHRVLAQVRDKFGDHALAVRSSALSEDSWTNSNAGGFSSVLDVPGSDTLRLQDAINHVALSYGDFWGANQVLIQAMLTGVVRHGVVLTRTLNHGAPYYSLNFDETTDHTDLVTSGRGQHLRTVIVHRGWQSQPLPGDPLSGKIIEAVREIEGFVGHDALDVEFAVTADDVVHVLQIRPITIVHGRDQVDDDVVDQALQNAATSFERKQPPSPFVLGRRTIFGIMPDWNPAEIIGPTPRQLALSLYQYLVTDEIWATQRAEYGYRDVRPHPLMFTFGGHPYIDVRACFNSFMPSAIPDHLAGRLIDYYLDLLEDQPQLHDKVEFAVAFTCLDFDFDERSRPLLQNGFSEADLATLRTALAGITRQAPGRCQGQLDQIALLEKRFHHVMEADLDPLAKAFALIEDCRRFGTLPFAHLARAAFVASSLLRSLEKTGVTTREQTDCFLKSLNTVSGSFERDGWAVAEGGESWEEFVGRYAHLRPGTYEVTSPTYAEDPDRYLRPTVKARPPDYSDGETVDFWDEDTRARIQNALSSEGLPWTVKYFEGFLRQAIEGREYSKFVFSRNLSSALDELVRFGKTAGIDRGRVSHIGIQWLLALHTGMPVTGGDSSLIEQAKKGEEWHRVAQALELPPLLVRVGDIFAYERHLNQPNFVTSGRVVAEAIDLANQPVDNPDLRGLIVLIPQADPGFDWLFGHGIAGLITMYGGANSHMTIRAAEFGLPAAIGVGQALYDQLSGARLIELDCTANWVRALR